jgi:T5orf172 domain
MERRGYVYVLATAYQDGGGQKIIKIGRTNRSPETRVRELSRGGPTGMLLIGAVPCRDMVELEKRTHQHFHLARFRSGGGTEYFTASADDVLNWLRTETPRFDLESARKDAWAEYTESKPFKTQGSFTLLAVTIFSLSPALGFFIQPFHFWTLLVGPFLCFAILKLAGSRIRRLSYMKKLEAELQSVQRNLELKYHLPVGGVRYSK